MSVRATVMLLNVFLNPAMNTDNIGISDIDPMSLARKGHAVDVGNETYNWLQQQRFTKIELAQCCTCTRTGYTDGGRDVVWDC